MGGVLNCLRHYPFMGSVLTLRSAGGLGKAGRQSVTRASPNPSGYQQMVLARSGRI